MEEVTSNSLTQVPWGDAIVASPTEACRISKTLKSQEARGLKTNNADHMVAVTSKNVFFGYQLAGKGTFSEVYYAYRCPWGGQEKSVEKVVKVAKTFQQQIKCLKSLSPQSSKSPFIDHAEEFYRLGEREMIVGERMDSDLSHVTWKSYDKPGTQLVIWLKNYITGLASFHRRNMVHRDIKPANFLVNHAGKAKVTDFGLSRKISRKEHSTAITPGYGAPFIWKNLDDQIRRRGMQTEGADIFAFGRTIQNTLKNLLSQYNIKPAGLDRRFIKFSSNQEALEKIQELHEQYGDLAASTPRKDGYLTVISPDRQVAFDCSVEGVDKLEEIDFAEKQQLHELARLAMELQEPTLKGLYKKLGVQILSTNYRDLLAKKVLSRLKLIGSEQVNLFLQENQSPNPERIGQVVRKRDFGDEDESEICPPTELVSETEQQGAKKRLKFGN